MFRKYISNHGFVTIPCFLAGALLIAWAFLAPTFRTVEDDFVGHIFVPISIGISIMVAGIAFRTRWVGFSFWFGLALTGQAVSFQVTDAGPDLHYQHLRSVSEIYANLSPLIWGFLLLRSCIVLIGIGKLWKGVSSWIRSHFKAWQIVLILACFLISITTVSEDVSAYAGEFVLAGIMNTINLGNILLIALAIPVNAHESLRKMSRRLFGDVGSDESIEPGFSDKFVIGLAVMVVILAALLNFGSYERHPHVPDEVTYLTHAKFIANGVLTMPAPPLKEAFEVYLMKIENGHWYPVTPPGWAIILSIGTFIGVPSLVNPVLAGINLLLGYVLLRELYPKPVARLTILLLCLSPWYVFLGMSYMTHMSALTCALLAAIGVALARRKGSFFWALAGGLALGFISLIRPLEAVAMAALLGLWAIGLGGKRLKLSGTAGLVFGTLVSGGTGLLYNAKMTGNPLKFPVMEYMNDYFGPNANSYGFGADRGTGWSLDPNPGHGPIDALINSNLNVSTINTELFGWSIGSLLLIAVFIFAGKRCRSDYIMFATILILYVLHFFYYFGGGPDFAARYWFLMIVPLVVLSVRGIQTLGAKLNDSFDCGELRLHAVIIILCFMTLVNFIPWRAVDKYHNFRGMRPDIRYLAESYDFGRSLVLIQTKNDHFQHPDYDSAMIYNRLEFDADAPIYAWDRKSVSCVGRKDCVKVNKLEIREDLLKFYPDRPVWIVAGPSVTGLGYEVVRGPVKAEDLLKEERD